MPTEFGQMIRDARHARGLTLEDLAAFVGVTPGALSHIESGRRLPNPSNAVRIARALGISDDHVMAALDMEHSHRRRSSVEVEEPAEHEPPHPADSRQNLSFSASERNFSSGIILWAPRKKCSMKRALHTCLSRRSTLATKSFRFRSSTSG